MDWPATGRGMARRRQVEASVGPEQPFKGRQFTAEVILWAVRWYLMFPISYRDLRARDAIRAQSVEDVLSISTNFRSCASILAYVNERFETILQGAGQPGLTRLDAFHPDHNRGDCVAALNVAVASAKDKPSAEEQRDAEADAVADLCHRLIGRQLVQDHATGEGRLCRPGDIALLAPSGTDLWRYEEALERHSIPVATQAGKGFFRRQEVQDLIALTRILADHRDTLALGALLRGPAAGDRKSVV